MLANHYISTDAHGNKVKHTSSSRPAKLSTLCHQNNRSVVYSDANMNDCIICYPPLPINDADDEIHAPLQHYCKMQHEIQSI